jgi:signal peptidase I
VRKFLKGLLWVTGILAIIVVILRLTMFRVWTIPDDLVLDSSLRPTLASGDVVLLLTVGDRGFGSLVRCTDPEDPGRYVVGRVVGLQGDEVDVNPPYVTVNGTRYNTTDGCAQGKIEVPHPTSGSPIDAQCQRVQMAGGWHYRADIPSTEGMSKHKVGPGRVFLLSDDRTFHDDSRDFGAIMADTCKEMIVFRLWGKTGFSDSEHRFTYIR